MIKKIKIEKQFVFSQNILKEINLTISPDGFCVKKISWLTVNVKTISLEALILRLYFELIAQQLHVEQVNEALEQLDRLLDHGGDQGAIIQQLEILRSKLETLDVTISFHF